MSFASKTVRKITSWSFSRWSVYEECPAKAKYKFIDKLKEPGSAAMDRGTALHKQCEDFLKGVKKTVPKDVKLIGDTLKDLRKRGALAEADFTFKQDWSPTRWDDWNGAWCRIKADVTIPPVLDGDGVAEIHDFKTGGQKKLENNDFEEYYTQLELYGLAGLLTFPAALKVKSSLVFIDFGRIVEAPEILKRGDEKKLMKKWEVRTKRMLNDTTFKPKPGNACRWCNFRKSNGGPCQF